ARKVAGEKGLVDRDVLDPDDPVALETQDAVHEEQGIAVRHDLLDRVDVELDRARVSVPGSRAQEAAGLFGRGEPLDETDVRGMPRLDREEVSLSGPPQKIQVSEEIEDLVAHEFVIEAKRLLVQDSGGLHDHRVLKRPAQDHAALAELFDIALEHEG